MRSRNNVEMRKNQVRKTFYNKPSKCSEEVNPGVNSPGCEDRSQTRLQTEAVSRQRVQLCCQLYLAYVLLCGSGVLPCAARMQPHASAITVSGRLT